MNTSILFPHVSKVLRNINYFRTAAFPFCREDVIDPPETLELVTNNYQNRYNESLEKKKARLLYQSRKRGMLENDLILSTFAQKYLHTLDEKQADEYDKIINLPSNDWDLYNWAIGTKPTPPQFENSVMELLRNHAKNTSRQKRLRQPALYNN